MKNSPRKKQGKGKGQHVYMQRSLDRGARQGLRESPVAPERHGERSSTYESSRVGMEHRATHLSHRGPSMVVGYSAKLPFLRNGSQYSSSMTGLYNAISFPREFPMVGSFFPSPG